MLKPYKYRQIQLNYAISLHILLKLCNIELEMETLLKSQDFKAMFCFTEAETYNSRLQSEIFSSYR
jgi:hypothetical protein